MSIKIGRDKYNNEFIIEDNAIEKFKWIESVLPDPWLTEFMEDVLVYNDSYNSKDLNKTFMYYIDDCFNELPEEVHEKIEERYIMITI